MLYEPNFICTHYIISKSITIGPPKSIAQSHKAMALHKIIKISSKPFLKEIKFSNRTINQFSSHTIPMANYWPSREQWPLSAALNYVVLCRSSTACAHALWQLLNFGFLLKCSRSLTDFYYQLCWLGQLVQCRLLTIFINFTMPSQGFLNDILMAAPEFCGLLSKLRIRTVGRVKYLCPVCKRSWNILAYFCVRVAICYIYIAASICVCVYERESEREGERERGLRHLNSFILDSS